MQFEIALQKVKEERYESMEILTSSFFGQRSKFDICLDFHILPDRRGGYFNPISTIFLPYFPYP